MKQTRTHKIILLLLALFLVGDAVYTCTQFYYTPLDGDMAESILPEPSMNETFEDPLGVKIIIK